MSHRAFPLIEQHGGVLLAVKVVPGASRDRIVGPYGSGLKITVTKPPQAGAANQAVVALLAQTLRIPTSHIQIAHGQSSPRKQVLIRGITADVLRQLLAAHLG